MTALTLAPAAAALIIIAVWDTGPGVLAAAGVTAVALAAGIAYRHVRDLALLRAAIEALGTGAAKVALERPVLFDAELDEAVARAAREHAATRHEMEAALAGHEAVVSGLPDPLILVSADGRITGANPAARELCAADPAGRDLAAVLRHPALLAAVDEVLTSAAQRVVEFDTPGGVPRHFAARIARLPTPTRDGTVAIIALHDLTALKRAEQMRADFIANASHELRTPLTSLLGFIETLRGPAREDAAARERFLTVMYEQAARMSRLVEDLLSLSRIELHEHTPPHGRADVADLVRRVTGMLELQARRKAMRFVIELPDLPPVAGDPDELIHVFQNLLDNAIKYGRAGTEIRITGKPAAPGSAGARRLGRAGVIVAVHDQGEGIEPKHLPRLTERFYRVDTARSRQLGGTGLGLAIVKHILNRHRGVLDIESTPGRGSVFTVYLPAATPARENPVPRPGNARRGRAASS